MKQIGGGTSITGGQRPRAGLLPAGSGQPSAPPEQALFQPELGRSLRMHGKLAVLASLVGLALTCAYFFRLWPIYEAKSLLFVQPASGSLMNQNNANRWPIDGATYESYLQQKMGDVTRPDVLANALKKMEPGLWQTSGESDQAAADRLGHTIQVERSGAYQMSIGVRSAKPETAAALANAVTTAYLETTAHDSKVGDTQRLAILKEEHDRVQAELAADRAEQAALSRQLGMAAPAGNAPDLYDEQIAATRTELIRARTEHDEAAARFASMNLGVTDASSAIDAQADEVAAADPGLGSMKTSLNQRKAAIVHEMSGLTVNHPLYKQDAAEIEKINTELESASRTLHTQAAAHIQQKLRSDMERTAAVEDKLNGQLRSAVGAAAGASIKLQRANDIAADITRLQNRYTAVDEQLHNLMLDSGAPGAISLISAAVPPLHAIRTGVFRNTLVLAIASILFGLFIAVLAHKMDPRIYIASDVENLLGFAPMAQLPNWAQVSAEVEAEHLIRLAGDIEHVALHDGIQTVVLTSAAAGVGVGALVARLRPLLCPTAANLSEGAAPNGVNLVEAPPLLLSAEAEFQVRHAGWTIAVIESGHTTRAELRQLATALQRLDAPAVGFILNQIPLEKADPGFRRSVRDAERHVERNGGSSAHRILEQRTQMAAMAPAPQEQLHASFASNTPPVALEQQTLAAPAYPDAQAPLHPGADPWWLGQFAPAQAPQPTPVQRAASGRTASSSAPPSEPRFDQVADSRFNQNSSFDPPDNRFAAASFAPPAPPPVPVASRLNGLRGAAFHRGLMNLSHGSDPRDESPAPPQPAPPQQQAAYVPPSPAAPSAYPAHAAPAPPVAPAPNPAYSTPAPAVSPAPRQVNRPLQQFNADPRQVNRPVEVAFTPSQHEVVAQPEFLPPREFIPVRAGDADDEGNANRDRRDPYDELDILPSWRGQYRKRS